MKNVLYWVTGVGVCIIALYDMMFGCNILKIKKNVKKRRIMYRFKRRWRGRKFSLEEFYEMKAAVEKMNEKLFLHQRVMTLVGTCVCLTYMASNMGSISVTIQQTSPARSLP